jgi:predicted GNAT family acetyltransferase
LTVIPLCPFVAGYVKKHQEYLDLVEKEYRGRVTR